MNKLLLFAGTTEGRELAEYLDRQEVSAIVCVATEYGEALLEDSTSRHQILQGRLTMEEMKQVIAHEQITHVVDATHPYAAVVTQNIQDACRESGCRYLRLLRAESDTAIENHDAVFVDSVQEAVDFLKNQEGVILAATGSKELSLYTAIPDYRHRVVARILSTAESMTIAARSGFAGKNLICMQGPFSEELNIAMLRAVGASWMVTKESGRTGGFPEKVNAARRADARLVVVGRPNREEGYTPGQIRQLICREFSIQPRRWITLVGIGMGTKDGMTRQAWDICQKADALIGAERMLAAASDLHKPVFKAYMAKEIRSWVDAHPEYERIAILLSGDVGFYSGAKKLEEVFAGEQVDICVGISSVVYLCGQLHTAWEDVKLVSLHGRQQNLISAVRENRKVFVLVGKQESFQAMCEQLITYQLGDVTIHVGSDLSYPEEAILTGTPQTLRDAQISDLAAVLIENGSAECLTTHGLADEEFTRAKVPMTKEEVRSVSLSRLHLRRDSVIYDIGAGTGSVSIEMALRSPDGAVYAIERKEEAAALIRENAMRLGTPNLIVVEGMAPEAMEGLPVPTHAFIGGSAGNMYQILDTLRHKNPQMRIVINAIALETVSQIMQIVREFVVKDLDISCLSVARAKEVGGYHMMMGQNPVYVISFTLDGQDEHLF